MDFNFTSQICTTKEQSERLLALGLKKVTADCVVSSIGSKDRLIHTEEPIYVMESLTSKRIPNYLAWSLHRLIEILDIWYLDLDFHNFANAYEQVISYFEERVKGGFINKNYLEE